jgi:hypothetical protein
VIIIESPTTILQRRSSIQGAKFADRGLFLELENLGAGALDIVIVYKITMWNMWSLEI